MPPIGPRTLILFNISLGDHVTSNWPTELFGMSRPPRKEQRALSTEHRAQSTTCSLLAIFCELGKQEADGDGIADDSAACTRRWIIHRPEFQICYSHNSL